MIKMHCLLFALAVVMFICGCTGKVGNVQNIGSTDTQAQTSEQQTTPVVTEDPTPVPTERPKMLKTCYLLDSSNVTTYAFAAKERDTWAGSTFTEEDAPEQLTVSFDGENYTGTYQYSSWETGSSHMQHYYEMSHPGGGIVEFAVDGETGELTYINVMALPFFARQLTLPELDDPETETLAIAKEYAAMFADIDEYDFHSVSSWLFQEDWDTEPYTYYTHVLARSVCGIETADEAVAQVTSKGDLASISVGDSRVYEEAMKKADEIAAIDVEGSVAAALADFPLSGGELTGEFSITRELIGLNPDGETVICVYVEAGSWFDMIPEEEQSPIGIVFVIYV